MWAAGSDGRHLQAMNVRGMRSPHSSPENHSTGVVMTWIARIAAVAVALTSLALVSASAQAQAQPQSQGQPQAASDLTNGNIEFAYYPPKSVKYQAVLDRLKSRHVLELLSQFLAPLRLPHKLYLVTIECGENPSPRYVPDNWAILLCYEFNEILDRVAPKQGQPAQGFTHDEVVVGSFVGVVLHEAGHAVFDMLDVPVFGREEDAADEMASFIALQFNKDVARTITRGFAYFWSVLGNPKEWAQYSDEHGTSTQRFYNALCIGYGGDPQTFKEFVDKGWLPKERAANCAAEYQQISLAFQKTVLPFVDVNLMKQVQARDWLKASAPKK
jgi:Putative metallopeptidase